MKRLVLALALLSAGCASAPGVLRIAAETGRLICGALGCPCTAGGIQAPAPTTRRVVAVDLLPDGGVRPVYQEASR